MIIKYYSVFDRVIPQAKSRLYVPLQKSDSVWLSVVTIISTETPSMSMVTSAGKLQSPTLYVPAATLVRSSGEVTVTVSTSVSQKTFILSV